MSLCLAAGAITASLALDAFTLAWAHSVEKLRWEEDWRIEGQHLVLVAARIRGTGAGMEMPAGAALRDGVWHYRPKLPPLPTLRLTHSPYAGGYEICSEHGCHPLTDLLPGLAALATIELAACPP